VVAPGVTTPSSYANTIAEARSRTPSFPKMLPTWVFDGRLGDVQGVGDFCVGRSAGHQPQDVVLTVGQQLESCGVAGRRGNDPAIAVEHPRRNGGGRTRPRLLRRPAPP
jgi:hypothetical protein